MKHGQRVWNLFCLITALSVFVAVMAEARLAQFFMLAGPVTEESRHILTEVKRQPDLAFFWALTQKVSRPHSDLSDEQKFRVQEEFRRLFFQVIVAEQEALSKDQEEPSSFRHFGQILAEHRQAIHSIFTPQQRHKHHTRKAVYRMIAELHAAPMSAQNAFIGTELVLNHLGDGGQLSSALSRSSKFLLPQRSPSTLFECDLHQLQTLRL